MSGIFYRGVFLVVLVLVLVLALQGDGEKKILVYVEAVSEEKAQFKGFIQIDGFLDDY